MSEYLPVHPELAVVPLWLLRHLPVLTFLFAFGASVGSFVNVVVYRLPAGMSVISPPSRCPTCGARLRFFRENLPILGWLMVRGRCRYCGVKISPQYMVVEITMALLFTGLYAALFMTNRWTPWWGAVGGPWWSGNGIVRVWPCYLTLAFMMASLVAMTIIDARTMTIPIEIPTFVTITAFVAYPLQSLLPHGSSGVHTWPIPGTTWLWFLMAVGGMLGLILSYVLLRIGVLRYSFEDYYEYVSEEEAVGDYPHARREMLIEIGYLGPAIVGLIIGYFVGTSLPASLASPPEFVQAIGGTLIGYLTGGGLIWAIRILGSLAFGREAMGLGDVHLLAAIGAVLGWFDPILIFFIAPFSGILWVVASMGLSSVFRTKRRELSYGPHLAVATVVVVLCRPGIDCLLTAVMPGVPLPVPGLVRGEDLGEHGPPGVIRAAGGADNLAPGPRPRAGTGART